LIIAGSLPNGCKFAAREHQAFRRARYRNPHGELFRLLLPHAVNGSGLRDTAAQAKAAEMGSMSAVVLFKGMQILGWWLE